jgi:glycosyltransferase involved in cell wall biosynthesis
MNSVCTVMTRIAIGIYFDEGSERLRSTLSSLRANTSGDYHWMLLQDGLLDQATRRLTAQFDLPWAGLNTPAGSAACFNRLVTSSQDDVFVFLEAGCMVAPGWLDAILAALESDPHNGLAGPSTNRSWNEQAAFPGAAGTPQAIAQTARMAVQRFGSASRTLEPLHSLADFCYAVKREVIEKIGAADEAYGLGPCWEMDYNIRAHRAGFRGVWACSSYIYRPPFTARRAREEARGFQSSRQRYQDKFCALRLTGSRPDYEPHCRGDACEHFAPAELVQVRLPISAPVNTPAACVSPVQVNATQPLVSCIMVTRDRPDFVLQSIRYFQRQDYPHRELIILDDGPVDLSARIGTDDRIRYVKLPGLSSIGAKRNRGCQLARGDFIAHWDDDDWYAPERLSTQLATLLSGSAEITALRAGIFFDLPRWRFWQCSAALHRRLFVEDVHGGTLVYKRMCWDEFARYPDVSLAEDAGFLRRAIQRGRRLRRLQNNAAFIYLRHSSNAWHFECGQYLDPHGWSVAPEPKLTPEDLAFYAAHSSNPPRGLPPGAPATNLREQPLVSCIMPTADRRVFVPQSIRYFLSQDYPNRELVVVDDGADPVADLIPQDARIHYVRLPGRQTVGAKRNIACEHARGKIIAHWDDDDWIASWRLSYQVEALSEAVGNSVCGLSSLLYFDPANQRAWFYAYPECQRRWLAGNTLCYHRDLWRQHQFPNVNEGEDTRFVWSLRESSILPLPNHTFYVAIVHEKNTSPKRTRDVRWLPRSLHDIQSALASDFTFYETWTKKV